MAQRRPDLLFIVAPVRVAGRIYYRLLAGPSEDSIAAERLRASLAETLSGDNGIRWIVRETPLAFHLGEFESKDAAEDRMAEVKDLGVGAYVLEVVGASSPAYRVYAGAYESPEEADVMRAALSAALSTLPPLEPRMGLYGR